MMRTIRMLLLAVLIVTLGLLLTGTSVTLPFVSASAASITDSQLAFEPPARPIVGPPGPRSNDTVPGVVTPEPVPPTTSMQVAPQPTTSLPPTVSAPVQPVTCGLLTNFDQFGNWKRGDEPYGTFAQTAEQAYSSPYSGKLTYSFPTPGNDYVVFKRTMPLGGIGKAVTAWVYGDASGHYLNCWVQDATGEVWSFPFGRVQHTGWQLMSAPLDVNGAWPTGHVSGPANGILEYPVSLHALVLDDAPDTYTGAGTIYIDDLSCSEIAIAASPEGISPPPPGPQTTPGSPSQGQSSAACTVTLLEPADGSQFSDETEIVTLRWQSNRALAPNEYFFVNVPFPHGGQTWYDGTWRDPGQRLPDGTRDTSWNLRDYLCQPEFSDTGGYSWYVALMQQVGAEKSLKDLVICKSSTRSFTWSGCAPPAPPPGDDGYDLYVRRIDFMSGSPSVGDPVTVFIMIATDISPDGEPYFPKSHFRWRIDGDSPWHEESCPDNTMYASCTKEVHFSYDSSGEHNFKVEADNRDEVSETDEGNNTKKWPMNVSP